MGFKGSLFNFQVEGLARLYQGEDMFLIFDTGTGKSVTSLALASVLFDDEAIDHVLLICEKNKLDPTEWPSDIEKFTDLSYVVYHGTPQKRAKMRESLPQIILTTYETAKNDAVQFVKVPKRKNPKMVPGVLLEALRGKRVLVVWDEVSSKLSNRGSGLHKAHLFISKELKAQGGKLLGLTATPIERSPEGFYNLGRIFMPDHIGTVAQFERDYVKARDIWGNPSFKNLGPDDHVDPEVITFADRMAPIVIRKRKTDPDVVDQFPKVVEEYTYIDLSAPERDFYKALQQSLGGLDYNTDMQLWGLLRRFLAHPQALLDSKGALAQQVVEHVGQDFIRSLPSTKTRRLVEYLEPLVQGQGAQAVVFTFFASAIPFIQAEIEKAGMKVSVNHGSMTTLGKTESKQRFLEGGTDVFLSTDAGARGINLPNASYVVEAELSLTHCLPPYSVISTPTGPRRMEEIEVGDDVLSMSPEGIVPSRVVDKFYSGVAEVFKVKTKNGTLVASGNHPVLVRVDGSMGGVPQRVSTEWRTISDLKVGDRVAQPISFRGSGNRYAPDGTEITRHMAQFMGVWLGDGSYSKGGIQVAIPLSDPSAEFYRGLPPRLFMNRGSGRSPNQKWRVPVPVSEGRNGFAFSTTEGKEWMKSIGFVGGSYTKRIPPWVYGLSEDLKMYFLAGILDSDGSIQKTGVFEITLANEMLVYDIKHLLLSLGVESSNVNYIPENPAPRIDGVVPKQDFYEAWHLSAGNPHFWDTVPTANSIYEARLRKAASKIRVHKRQGRWVGTDPVLPPDCYFRTVSEISSLGEDQVYDLQIEGHANFIAEGFIVHNSMRVQRQNRIHRIDSKNPSVTFQGFITRNTIEEGIANMVMTRNEWSDVVVDYDAPDDGSFLTAEKRRELLLGAKAV